MFFYNKPLADCSEDEVSQLKKLTLRAEKGTSSWMATLMDQLSIDKMNWRVVATTAFMAVDPDNQQIIAWSFIESATYNKKYHDFGVYVTPNYRRRGIAKQLISQVELYTRQMEYVIRTYPHDDKSEALFKGVPKDWEVIDDR